LHRNYACQYSRLPELPDFQIVLTPLHDSLREPYINADEREKSHSCYSTVTLLARLRGVATL
jgi:hypothetical protein